MLKVRDIMTKNVITTSKNVSVLEAAAMMESIPVSCLIVVEDNEPIGIISERDMVKEIVIQQKDSKNTIVKNLMKSPVITIDANEDIISLVRLMNEKKIRRVAVVEGEKLVGIVTETNIVRSLERIRDECLSHDKH